MPKILHRAPQWLDYGTPGFDFFKPDQKEQQQTEKHSPSRRIAHRSSEVFLAVGTEVRWSDLRILKECGEGDARSGRMGDSNQQQPYKVLLTPAARPIQQLSISPSGSFIAVLTSHTCHVCILPPRESLNFPENNKLKLRSFTVGPTAHVLEQSPLVSVSWHPLSPSGNALVTVTKDACVRLWELDQGNRSTFNEPSLAVDLKKLANASSARDDLTASQYGINKGYSPDFVDMEVAASCFGGRGWTDEDGWASMTLWVAMTEGDVYALCPFLPSKFFAPSTMLPSLSTSVVAKKRILDHDRLASSDLERRVAEQQSRWLSELDEQEPFVLPGTNGSDVMEVYERPKGLSDIAKLQGPFQVSSEFLGEVTDIYVVAPKINEEDLFDEEEYDELAMDEGLSIGIVCLATTASKVHVCLNVEGVEAEWLPSKRSRTHQLHDEDGARNLLLFENIDLARSGFEAEYPAFTVTGDRYETFVTQPTGVYSLTFRPWINALENELSAPQAGSEGIAFRMNIILDASKTTVEQLTADVEEPLRDVNTAITVLDDSDMGYLVLTSAKSRPLAALLDVPAAYTQAFAPDSANPAAALLEAETRAPYQPADVFFQRSRLPAQIDTWRRESALATTAGDIKNAINFSPFTLQKITEAHRILSTETYSLGLAAAELFRRLERMMSEMRDQVDKVREISNRVNSVTGEDEFPEQKAGEPALVRGGRAKIQARLDARYAKTREIQDRVDRLSRKMRSGGRRDLSAKERAFAEEVGRIRDLVALPGEEGHGRRDDDDGDDDSRMAGSDDEHVARGNVQARFDDVRQMYAKLREQAETVQRDLEARAADGGDDGAGRPGTSTGSLRGGRFRQRKMMEVEGLLERETALINAVTERLERLQMEAR